MLTAEEGGDGKNLRDDNDNGGDISFQWGSMRFGEYAVVNQKPCSIQTLSFLPFPFNELPFPSLLWVVYNVQFFECNGVVVVVILSCMRRGRRIFLKK